PGRARNLPRRTAVRRCKQWLVVLYGGDARGQQRDAFPRTGSTSHGRMTVVMTWTAGSNRPGSPATALALVRAAFEEFGVGGHGPLRQGRPIHPVAVSDVVNLAGRRQPLPRALARTLLWATRELHCRGVVRLLGSGRSSHGGARRHCLARLALT